MRARARRRGRAGLVALLLAQLALTWMRGEAPEAPLDPVLTIAAIARPPQRDMPQLGRFRLVGAWQMESTHVRFRGYSALLALPGSRLLAISDRGSFLIFSPPDEPRGPAIIGPTVRGRVMGRAGTDSESATRDPATGRVWLGFETTNAITRHDLGVLQPDVAMPPAMARWPDNRGAEAMVRLADGRFIVLREGFGLPDDDAFLGGRRHDALLFRGDPVDGARPVRFSFVGPGGFYPVDIAQMPDGRVLILMRRLVWPFPGKFAGRIVVADPATITRGGDWTGRVVAKLSSTLPIDNFEGMAIEATRGRDLAVWLISDANSSVTQRTLLWKLLVDPAALPR